MVEGEGKADTLSEYTDLATQFGLVVLFSVVFPLAALLCLIASSLKLKAINYEMKYQRRIEPEVAFGIGQFNGIFTFIAHLAIVSNAALAYFKSARYREIFMENQDWQYTAMELLLLFVATEHALVALKMLIAYECTVWDYDKDGKGRTRLERTRNKAILRR